MSINAFVKQVLMDILTWHTNVSESLMHIITENFADRMSSSRHTVVPTYLTDGMYEAICQVHPGLDFKTANSIYVTAVKEYVRKDCMKKSPESEGSFW